MYEKYSQNSVISRDSAISQALSEEDLAIISNFKAYLIGKYGKSIISIVKKERFYGKAVPLSVFSKDLSMLETIVKYLKENTGLSITEIAKLTNRGITTIATTLKNAQKKNPSGFDEKDADTKTGILIPAKIIAERSLSTFEAVVIYLKDGHGLSFSEISKLLGRDGRNIWTIYGRARKKQSPEAFMHRIESESERCSISHEDLSLLKSIKSQIMKKYSMRESSLINIFESISSAEISIPISVFCQGISPLRAAVKYLREDAGLSLTAISKLLSRTPPLISSSYGNARRSELHIRDFRLSIPASSFSDRSYSVMETAVDHLTREMGLTITEAAAALHRNPSVVWKLKSRHERKRAVLENSMKTGRKRTALEDKMKTGCKKAGAKKSKKELTEINGREQ